MNASPVELLRVEVDKRPEATIVRLIGTANMVMASDLKDQLLDLVNECPPRLVLDLSELEFISSVGLSSIIAAHLRCRHHNGEIKLAGPQPQIAHLLRVTNFDKLFVVHESVASALGS